MTDKAQSKPAEKPVIVTGLSGAGLSSVLKSLEDQGFEVFDNFPLSLVPALIKDSEDPGQLAIGIDTRTRGFSAEAVLSTVKDIDAFLVFITCDDTALQQRFTATRRRHPLAQNEPVRSGIEKERTLLKPIRAKADLTIDSTRMSVHDLRHILEGHFLSRKQEALTISLISFSFRRGIPREADIVMDVRFLKNPHWVADLKPKTGLDKEVGDYIEQDEAFENFLQKFEEMLEPLIPRYTHEGKHYLTIAVGCTGGRHRSVYSIEKLSEWLKSKGREAHIEHRDIKKSG